jgi:iron complex outermembrane receptor protein
MKDITFNKTRLAASISLLLGAGIAPSSFAQEAEPASDGVEIIQVKGIRGSLARSMDIKREGNGVVDAISAEEMGKFPDTNLAESLQRITGVTVSRTNGEGSQITVRGFGPDFNLITLNGRQMPGTGNSRSYNLEDLSSAGVSALEVFKTARAENPSGGLGATVNIVTSKPLNSPGLKYSVSGKGIYDTSNELGDDVTPELAALYSNTFADNTIGVAVSLSLQERDFRQQGATVTGWNADQGPFNEATNFVDLRPDATSDEEDTLGGTTADGKSGHTYLPRQFGYNINDIQRSRKNAQLTLQYAPTEDITMSLDYVRSESETARQDLGFGVWFNFGANVTSYEADENGTINKFTETGGDWAHNIGVSTTLVEAESIGFNVEWQFNDDFHFEFDYHDSSNASNNGADKGSGNTGLMILGPNNIETKTYDFSTGDIPNLELTWPGGAQETNPGDFAPNLAIFTHAAGESTVKQAQFHGEWLNPDDSFLMNIKFGLASTEQTLGGFTRFDGNQGPGASTSFSEIYPDSMFTRQNTGDLLDELAGGGSDIRTNYYYTYDFTEAVARLAANSDLDVDPTVNSRVLVTEETLGAYLQSAMYFEIADYPVDVNVGIRYEQTDVTSDVLQQVERGIVWQSATEWVLQKDASDGLVTTVGDHDVLLPNIDIKVELSDELIARMSAGKTVTRAPIGNLAGIRNLSDTPKPGGRKGSSGNTNLLPFESTNFDLSLEYYYADASYVSLGYFSKSVENFIANSFSIITVDGIRDPYIGPRANAAIASLAADGIAATDENIFARIIETEGGTEVAQNNDDPLTEWNVSQPSNGDTKKVDGIEFAVQHMFGESGFGGSFNATLVDGDVEFDVESFEEQSPLTGLSDSANVQLFYEKDGLSVKITYAWRDDFLIGVGQDAATSENPPQFGKEYAQTDFSINYDVNDELTVFFEGLNITNETEQAYGRYEEQFLFARQYGPRYALGARYTF